MGSARSVTNGEERGMNDEQKDIDYFRGKQSSVVIIDEFASYGTSMLNNIIKTFKRVRLMEDASMIYRSTRKVCYDSDDFVDRVLLAAGICRS